MQADSSEASADFSQKLYEQLRFDDVWNKRRLTWYIKASQKLVNRSVVEKLWLFAHATQILGILWINMSAPLPPNFSVFCSADVFFLLQVSGRAALAQRFLQPVCAHQSCRTSRSSHTTCSVLPPLCCPRHSVVNFLGSLELKQPWPALALFKFIIVVGFVFASIWFLRLLSMGCIPAQALHRARQQNAFLPPIGAGAHQPVLYSDSFCAIATCYLQQLQHHARSCPVRRLLRRVRARRISCLSPSPRRDVPQVL